MRLRRLVSVLTVGLASTAALATSATAGAPPTCEAWDVEYSLAAKLKIEGTPMGQGDGVYPIGPGRVVLRFDDVNGQPGGTVNMRSYHMREYIVIKSKALFWTTTATNDSKTTATPDTCGSAAEGMLVGHTLRWAGPLRGYRTDGTLRCEGSLCGKFGAPPQGLSELHIGPGPVTFQPFELAPDMSTFTMPATFASRTEMPKQTSYVTLAGRETKRSCAPKRPCPPSR
jgi:hypothetical protein